MGAYSKIGWCDHTHNEWWGCAHWSRGCRFCYANTWHQRFAPDGESLWRRNGPRRRLSENTRNNPYRWNRAAQRAGKRAKVFASSMCDVFEDHPMLPPWRAELFPKMEATPWLIWQVLTHRPENIAAMVPPAWLDGGWPDNVWAGATVEAPEYLPERVNALRGLPPEVPVRFLSVEPWVAGPLDLTAIDIGGGCTLDALTGLVTHEAGMVTGGLDPAPINWVIAGGESGGKGIARMDPAWLTSLAAQCADRGVPFFAKQTGTILAREWGLASSKGDDPAEWPADVAGLWVQQHPTIHLPETTNVH